jgi:hypothetical protein
MQLDEKAVRRIIGEVWNLVSNASAEDSGDGEVDGETVLVSSVDVSGAWEGAVAVRCSHSLARLLAARAHDLEGSEPTDAQVHFALGAIARLIGVNVKEEDGYPGSTTWLSSLGHPFSVTVSLRAVKAA